MITNLVRALLLAATLGLSTGANATQIPVELYDEASDGDLPLRSPLTTFNLVTNGIYRVSGTTWAVDGHDSFAFVVGEGLVITEIALDVTNGPGATWELRTGLIAAGSGSGTVLDTLSDSGAGSGDALSTRDIVLNPGEYHLWGRIVTGLDDYEFLITVCSPFPGGGSSGGCFPGSGPFPAPEPGTLALLGLGLAGLAFTRRRKQ